MTKKSFAKRSENVDVLSYQQFVFYQYYLLIILMCTFHKKNEKNKNIQWGFSIRFLSRSFVVNIIVSVQKKM